MNGTVIVPVGIVFSIKVVLRFILALWVLPLGSFGAMGSSMGAQPDAIHIVVCKLSDKTSNYQKNDAPI